MNVDQIAKKNLRVFIAHCCLFIIVMKGVAQKNSFSLSLYFMAIKNEIDLII